MRPDDNRDCYQVEWHRFLDEREPSRWLAFKFLLDTTFRWVKFLLFGAVILWVMFLSL